MSLDLGVGINGVKCFIIVGTMQRSFQSFAFGLMMYPDKSTRNALSTLALTRSSKWQSTSLVRSLHSLLYHVQCKWLTAIRFTRRSEHFTSLLWICSADVNLLQPWACVISCLRITLLIHWSCLFTRDYSDVSVNRTDFRWSIAASVNFYNNEAFRSRSTIFRLFEPQITRPDLSRFTMCVSILLSRIAVPTTFDTCACTSAHSNPIP